MSINALTDANISVNPNFTPQMEAHTLENDNDLKNVHHITLRVSAYDRSAYNSLNQLP